MNNSLYKFSFCCNFKLIPFARFTASLNHHMQMHDKGVISASQQPGSQYSDSKSAYPEPCSAASTGGIIQNSGRQQNSKTSAVTNGTQAPRPAQKGHTTQRTGRNFSSSVPQKRQINKNIGDFTGKEGDPHYVDPPQEFYFKSTKEAKYEKPYLYICNSPPPPINTPCSTLIMYQSPPAHKHCS